MRYDTSTLLFAKSSRRDRYSIPEGREILELREWRRSWLLGMDFPMINPAFKFSLILFLFALGIGVSLWAKP